MTMEVVFLLIFSVIFGGWAIWVSGRGETKAGSGKQESTDS